MKNSTKVFLGVFCPLFCVLACSKDPVKISDSPVTNNPDNQVFIENDTIALTRAVVSYYGFDTSENKYNTTLVMYNGDDMYPDGEYTDTLTNIADLFWIDIYLKEPGLPSPGTYELMYAVEGNDDPFIELELARNYDFGVDTTQHYYFSDGLVKLEILHFDEESVELLVSGDAIRTSSEEIFLLRAAYSGGHHYEDSVAANSWNTKLLPPKRERIRY